MFEYFYNEIIRKTVIGFGTLFNGIQIQRKDSSNNVFSIVEVPIAYGPTQKFLARLEQSPDLNKPVQITLPRLSFEMVGLNYDPTRKVNPIQTFVSSTNSDSTDMRVTYMPVPYNVSFELSIMTKSNDDMLQIVEQILPYFQPSYTISIDLVELIGEKRDIPITLDNIVMDDSYEGDFSTRRALIYTLRFTAKTYIFGPTSSSASKDIVKKVSIGYAAGHPSSAPTRDVTYRVEPQATKSYTDNVVTTLSEDIKLETTIFEVADASGIKADKYIFIGDEELFVRSKTGNKITVDRGRDNTKAEKHVAGAEVKGIDYTETTLPSIGTIGVDSAIIEDGDNFGFDGGYL